jgi:hypothetical protein
MKYTQYVNELFVRTDDAQEKTVMSAMSPAVAYDINMLQKLLGDHPKLQEVIDAVKLSNSTIEEMRPMLDTVKAYYERRKIIGETDKKITEAIPSLISAINDVVQRGMRSFIVIGERLKLIDTATKTEITKSKATAVTAIEVWARHKPFSVDEFVTMLTEHFITIGNADAASEIKDFITKIKAKEIELEKVYRTQTVSYDIEKIAGATGETTTEANESNIWNKIKVLIKFVYEYVMDCVGILGKWSDSIRTSENNIIHVMS